MELTDGRGYDDIVVLAPSAGVAAGAARMLAPGGVMNVFAGLPQGTKAPIDLTVVAARGARFTGTSGSSIRDLRSMLDEAEAGRLDPNLSVVAVSGLNDSKKGLEGVVHQAYPGKVVIYPQIADFPLTALEDLADVLPTVYAKLGPNHSWTVEAEAEFLKELLP
jgi:threonine dehydrogenase-like Zn-dependent dehydrogenase